MLSVYGAVAARLGAFEAGIAEAAAANGRVLVSVFLDGGIDSLSILAPVNDPSTAPCARSSRCRPGTGRHSPRTRAFAGTPQRRRSTACTGPGSCRSRPAIGYSDPDQSHFTSRHYWEVGALDPERPHRLDGAVARRDR